MQLTVDELLEYTAEERRRWERWFLENGEECLNMPLSGRLDTSVGALILHIYGAELRWVQRILGEPLTEYRGRPTGRIDEVFGFGIETRKRMRDFVASARPEEWSRILETTIEDRSYRASIRKVVFHALLHEVRHWAQLARIMRERGFAPPGEHDLLTSAALV